MKNIFKITSILVLLISTVSCDDYLDVNDSIDNQNLNELTPNQLIVGAQALSAETFSNRLNRVGNWMGVAWSGNYLAFNDAYGEESRYQFSSTFYDDVWDDLYRYTSNFVTIEKYEDGANWNNQKAVAKILKAFYFQYVVDLYGDVPFSEAFEGTDNLFPQYDDAQDIYMMLIDSLDEAVSMIDADSVEFGSSDITFGSYDDNMTQWEAFANTIKLRYLVRLSVLAQSDATTGAYVTTKFTELSGAQFITEDVTINPGYSNVDDSQNPFWEIYGFNVVDEATDRGRQTGPSEFAFNLLDASSDPRLERLWKSSNDVFAGTPQNGTGNSAAIGDGILKDADADLPIMLAAESYFLQAEAVQRGYLSGDAKALFDQGIRSSFNYLDIFDIDDLDMDDEPDNWVTNYLSAIAADADLGFNGGDSLGAILTQKWIALTSVSGAELWIEYNRTGYPSNLPLPNALTDPNIPVRLLYPASEYSGNSNNVRPQTRDDAFTSKIFWDVN